MRKSRTSSLLRPASKRTERGCEERTVKYLRIGETSLSILRGEPTEQMDQRHYE